MSNTETKPKVNVNESNSDSKVNKPMSFTETLGARHNRRKTDAPAPPKVANRVDQGDRVATVRPSGSKESMVGRIKQRQSGDDETAPFVNSSKRFSQTMRAKDWSERGLVKVVPQNEARRHRIFPRTVIGISLLLVAIAVGIAFSGAAFYAYYENRLSKNEQSVARFVDGFDKQFNDASGALDEQRTSAINQIRDELVPLDEYVSEATGVVNLPQEFGQSVWALETRNADGLISVGSAFAVVGHEGGTALITSYSVVSASTVSPAPPIEIVKGGQRITAELWSWDIDRDLAVIVVDSDIPALKLASNSEQVKAVGSRLFSMGGTGGQGSTAVPGVLVDNSELGLQHTIPVGTLFQGGPLVNGDGNVVGMSSLSYSPSGVDSGLVSQAPDVARICQVVLKCSETEGIVQVEVGSESVEE